MDAFIVLIEVCLPSQVLVIHTTVNIFKPSHSNNIRVAGQQMFIFDMQKPKKTFWFTIKCKRATQ